MQEVDPWCTLSSMNGERWLDEQGNVEQCHLARYITGIFPLASSLVSFSFIAIYMVIRSGRSSTESSSKHASSLRKVLRSSFMFLAFVSVLAEGFILNRMQSPGGSWTFVRAGTVAYLFALTIYPSSNLILTWHTVHLTLAQLVISLLTFRYHLLRRDFSSTSLFATTLVDLLLFALVTAVEVYPLFQHATFASFTPFLWTHLRRSPTNEELPQLPEELETELVYEQWKMGVGSREGGLGSKLVRFVWKDLWYQQYFAYLRVLSILLPPLLLNKILVYISLRNSPSEHDIPPLHLPLTYAVLIFISQLFATVAQGQILYTAKEIAVKVRSVCNTELFVKNLRIFDSPADESEERINVANTVAMDVDNISAVAEQIHQIWPEGLLILLVSTTMLWQLLGPSTLMTLLVILLLIPYGRQISAVFIANHALLRQASDKRLTLSSSIIHSIKTIKYFSWERPFSLLVNETRQQELSFLFKQAMLFSFAGATTLYTPALITLTTFVVHTKLFKKDLDAPTAFTAVALFAIVADAVTKVMYPWVALSRGLVGLRRVESFLKEVEVDGSAPASGSSSRILEDEIRVRGRFSWAKGGRFELEVDVGILIGGLNVVLGPVGSGKTMFLETILGETHCIDGAFPVLSTNRAIAYAGQHPFLLNTTIRNNILFGLPFLLDRYEAVVKACALDVDFKILQAGDETEVGERGMTLSGGQKARVGLARAVYSDSNLLLLDDVLSAVDGRVARSIFDDVIRGDLCRKRTVVLITQALGVLRGDCERAILFDNGKVSKFGSPEDVITDWNATVQLEEGSLKGVAEGLPSELVEDTKRSNEEKHKLITEEQKAEGAVSFSSYAIYIRAIGGVFVWSTFYALIVCAQLSDIALNLALKQWSQSYDGLTDKSPDYWFSWYCILAAICFVLYLGRITFFQWRSVVAARRVYLKMMSRIMGTSMKFFESTPAGRIINRLSHDMETVDQNLSLHFLYGNIEVCALVSIVITISVVLPQFFIVGAIIFISYGVTGWLYVSSSREINRLEAISRSPVMSIFTEASHGRRTIRAYGQTRHFMRNLMELQQETNRPYLTSEITTRWLAYRVDLIGCCVALSTSVFVLLRKEMGAALAGFVLAYSVQFTEKVLRLINFYSTMENYMSNVERISEYSNLASEPRNGRLPPAYWPSRPSRLEVENVTVRYGENLPPALEGVSFTVQPGERVGIVGRTGAGKSTLIGCFMRFFDWEGSVRVDGLELQDVQIDELRRRVAVIPQDCDLFVGTLRFNLDPFGEKQDSDLWDVLNRVGLSNGGSSVGTHNGELGIVDSLEFAIEEGGKNLSAGQRQLVALARGLLKLPSSPILIMDEPSASLDDQTDGKIQKIIREEARNTTVLCIAHRLKTVIDYDKILYLESGRVVEYDNPAKLLFDPSSQFYRLCEKSGDLQTLQMWFRH
ncbi:P-loop containing nucleoside triphosphate hydrolase protein [Atractiella rhizophila]|nr:P-loop containing nucleoside triphosphate hydrolase protein [Atractiella rhizophila]